MFHTRAIHGYSYMDCFRLYFNISDKLFWRYQRVDIFFRIRSSSLNLGVWRASLIHRCVSVQHSALYFRLQRRSGQHRSDSFASVRNLIDVNLNVFAIWVVSLPGGGGEGGRHLRPGDMSFLQLCYHHAEPWRQGLLLPQPRMFPAVLQVTQARTPTKSYLREKIIEREKWRIKAGKGKYIYIYIEFLPVIPNAHTNLKTLT